MQEIRFTKSLMASLVLAIFVSTSATAQMDDRQAMMDLVLQMQQLQDEVRMLRGMLEDQTMELEMLSNRQRDQYLDLDQRISELRGLPPGAVTARAGVASSRVSTTAAGTQAFSGLSLPSVKMYLK